MTGSNRVKSLMAAVLCALLGAQFLGISTAHAQAPAITSAADAGIRVNLWLLAMEVTQATQPWLAVNPETQSQRPIEFPYSPEGIPLVRGKRTVVRVYPGLEGPSAVMTGVEAVLTCQTSPEMPCLGPAMLKPVAPVLVDQTDGNDLQALQRDAARTWNFVLPDDWTTQPAPIRLTATVTAPQDQPECYDCQDMANSLTLNNLTFNATAPLRLNVLFGCVRRNASDPPTECDTAPFSAISQLFTSDDALIVQTFPVAARDIQITFLSPLVLQVDGDLEAYGGWMTAQRMTAFHHMVCDLARQQSGDQAPALNEITVGLVPGPTLGILGLGGEHCIVVAVDKDSIHTPDLVAEELGHALGRPHAGCAIHGEGAPCEPTYQVFPCAHGGICTPGFDTSALRVIDPGNPPTEPHAHDFMSYGDGVQWISPYTYRHLYDTLHALLPAAESSR